VSALILRRAGIGALVVSISAGMTSNLLFLAAFQFRLYMFLEPTLILGSGAIPAELLRWATVLDLFGYYLATAVLAYVWWRQLRPLEPISVRPKESTSCQLPAWPRLAVPQQSGAPINRARPRGPDAGLGVHELWLCSHDSRRRPAAVAVVR
jgi:hypothetical protein